eukprot:CAMPEP_0117510102 /NCGR_PEP_ID=MMETSP0784-20121206/27818_1 /TAXON_ID=39447 /ORGANISM="" /LENGTH=331 /DNA_ID=CAMNT_0005305731 /DNA_START=52 /DNA_END=1048 /DNA_ORIENTATION=+
MGYSSCAHHMGNATCALLALVVAAALLVVPFYMEQERRRLTPLFSTAQVLFERAMGYSSCAHHMGNATCALLALVVAAALLVVPFYMEQERRRLTPLFSTVECTTSTEDASIEVKRSILPPRLSIRSESTSLCVNTNPFDIEVLGGGGQVLLLPKLEEIGTVTVWPRLLPANSTGTAEKNIEINVESMRAIEVGATLLANVVSIVLNMTVNYSATPTMFGVGKTVEISRHAVCGFKVRAALRAQGPVQCAESMDQLVIPPLTHGPIAHSIAIPEPWLSRASLVRDVVCISVSGLSLSLSFLLLVCALWSCHQSLCQEKELIPRLIEEGPIE